MSDKHYQCELERAGDNGLIKTVTFIPEKFATVGQKLSLKYGEDWVEGWTVTQVYSSIDNPKFVDPHNAVKQHRKNTGDALPK